MSQNKTLFKYSRGLFVTAIAAIIAVTYNNCGQRAFQTERAFIPNEKLQQELAVSTQGKLDIAICADSSRYECTRKIYSQDVDYTRSEVDFPCLKMADGTEICASGLQFTYNSKSGAESCKEGCNDNYELEEFNCYYKLANMNGSYPIQATEENYEQALSETHAACLKIAGGQ